MKGKVLALIMLVFGFSFCAFPTLAAFNQSNTNISYPTNGTYLVGTINISIDFPDIANITVEYSSDGNTFSNLNTTNNAPGPTINISWPTTNGSFADGNTYALRVNVTNASDETDYYATIINNLVIDTTRPRVNNITTNLTNISGSATLRVQINVTDLTGLTNVSVILGNGSGPYVNATFLQGNLFEVNVTPNTIGCASDGDCTFNISAIDSFGFVNNTEQVTISVDSTPPAISVISPNATINNSYFAFRFSIVESRPNITLARYNLSLNGTTIRSGTFSISNFTINGTNHTYSNSTFFSSISTGMYNLSITASDTHGNVVVTRTNFTVNDTIGPTLSEGSPSGEQSSGTTIVSLQITSDENASCRYSTSDVVFSSMTSNFSDNVTAHNATVSVSDGNNYAFYVSCIDVEGNEVDDNTLISFSIASTSSSSGGGGGGGGGGDARIGFSVLSKNPVSKILSRYGRIDFRIQGSSITHSIRIKSIVGKVVTLSIQSDPIEVTLKENETKDVDIDGDKISDVRVSIASITSNSIAITISQPENTENIPLQSPTDPSVSAPEADTTNQQEIPAPPPEPEEGKISEAESLLEKEPSSSRTLLWTILFVIILIAAWGFWKKKNQKEKHHKQ